MTGIVVPFSLAISEADPGVQVHCQAPMVEKFHAEGWFENKIDVESIRQSRRSISQGLTSWTLQQFLQQARWSGDIFEFPRDGSISG